MSRDPKVKSSFAELPAEAEARREALVDLFGQHVFWVRNQVADKMEAALKSAEIRKKMGRIPAQPYEAVAALEQEAQAKALHLAREAVDEFIRGMLGLLMNRGFAAKIGEEHCIQYELNLEIHQLPKTEDDENAPPASVVERDAINKGGRRAFVDYFGTWRLRHEDHR